VFDGGGDDLLLRLRLLRNSALVDAPTLDPIGPITDREQDLVLAALAGIRQAEED